MHGTSQFFYFDFTLRVLTFEWQLRAFKTPFAHSSNLSPLINIEPCAISLIDSQRLNEKDSNRTAYPMLITSRGRLMVWQKTKHGDWKLKVKNTCYLQRYKILICHVIRIDITSYCGVFFVRHTISTATRGTGKVWFPRDSLGC